MTSPASRADSPVPASSSHVLLCADYAGSASAFGTPYCTPPTKEAYWYRKLFCEIFGENRQKVIPGFWQVRWDKDGKELTHYTDPSARTLEVYQDTLTNPSTDVSNPIDS